MPGMTASEKTGSNSFDAEWIASASSVLAAQIVSYPRSGRRVRIRAGCIACLTKPFTLATFVEAIEQRVERSCST